ncbi:hypothetical protein GTA08_BOTSDO03052 [Neofusicoccum parvum]|nr:hypothetical protein GTA08_BOTSDO03052 [Neofusicoccum parvum]
MAAAALLRRTVSATVLAPAALCSSFAAARCLLVRPFPPPHPMASVPPVHLVLDWDGTTTHHDTLHFLGKICADHARARSNKQDDAPASWDDIAKAYVDDLAAHASSYRPALSQRSTIAEEKAWLASLDLVDARSIRRVEDAGIFKGVTAAAVKSGAVKAVETGELALRDGWADLLAQATKITVLSVNWSAAFIRESLRAAAARDRDAEVLLQAVDRIDILANEIDGLDDPHGSSGLLNSCKSNADGESNGIRTSADKLANMPTPAKYGGDALVVYVGDSATDFEALLAADVGICIRDEDEPSSGQRELAETLARVGVEEHRIKLLAEMPPADDSAVRVYWAKNLREVALSLSSYC